MPLFGPEDVTVAKWVAASLGGGTGLGAALKRVAVWIADRDQRQQAKIETIQDERLKEGIAYAKTMGELAVALRDVTEDRDALRSELASLKGQVEPLRARIEALQSEVALLARGGGAR